MKYFLHIQLFTLLLLLISFGTLAQQNQYIFENIGIEQGLSQSTVSCILQDMKGVLWFATQDGLDRYDGYTFKVFRHDFENPETSISNGFVEKITEDNYGNIITFGHRTEFNVYSTLQERFYNWKNNTGKKNAISITIMDYVLIGKDNSYWMFSPKGLYKMSFSEKNNFDSAKIQFVEKFMGLIADDFASYKAHVIYDKDKNLILGYNNKCYFIDKDCTDYDKYTIEKLPANSFELPINMDSVKNVGLDKNSNLYLQFPDRIEKYIDFKNNKKQVFYVKQSIKLFVNETFFVDSKNWFYGNFGGVGVFSQNLLTGEEVLILKENGNDKSLVSNVAYGMIEDNKNNLWIGTSSGISKYNPKRNNFKHFAPKPDNKNWLQDPWPFAFAEDKHGDIWVGTYQGTGIYIYNKKTNTFRHIVAVPNKPINNILSLFKDSNNQMWIGTEYSGLGKYNEHSDSFSFYTYNCNDSLSISNNQINTIIEDKSGYLWIGTRNGVNKFDRKTGKFQRFMCDSSKRPSPEYYVASLLLNDDGSLWRGTHDGLKKLSFDKNGKPKFKTYLSNPSDSTSLSINQVFSLMKDNQGYIWVSTVGGGINKFDVINEKFKHYTVRNGLANNFVYGSLQDEFERIWISTNHGLSVLNTQTEKFINYTVNHGLQSNEFNQGAYFKDSQGYMYFGGVNGFNMFYPSAIQLDTTSSDVVFTDFKLFNKSVSPAKDSPLKQSILYTTEINLTYWQRDFSFEFASTNYSAPEDNQFAYMIENYHKDWVYIGNNHSISFTGFPHGEYILKVKAANADGVWSTNYASIRLIITPPFWETVWFKISMVVLLIVTVVTVIRLRTKNLVKAKLQLEQKVKERTLEIEKQKTEILDKNEELNLLNEEISTQRDNLQEFNEELTSRNEEIVAQKNEIEIKNISITSSIQYAQRIQTAVLPTYNVLATYFAEYFIMFKPRDIVSGDFYFIKQENNRLYIAAADCTGHGVPGAFMSMLGMALLNEIVRKPEISNSAQILNELRSEIKHSLQQTGQVGEQQDGMDIAFCTVNLDTLELSFAGAHNPLYIVKSEE